MQTAEELVEELMVVQAADAELAPRVKFVLALSAVGMSQTQIAQVADCEVEYVQKLLADPELAMLRDQLATDIVDQSVRNARSILHAATSEAARKQVDLMRHAKSEAVQLKATESILDRTERMDIIAAGGVLMPEPVAKLMAVAIDEIRKHQQSYKELKNSSDAFGEVRAGNATL